MERQSSRHSPRLDDELKRETESLERGAPVESRADAVLRTLQQLPAGREFSTMFEVWDESRGGRAA